MRRFTAPLAAGLLLVVPALLGLITGVIFLFPSLGPTAVMQAHAPHQRGSRPYSVVVGHLCGIAAGYAAVVAFGVGVAPSVFAVGHLTHGRTAASILAVTLTGIFQVALRALHPPAAATTLLIALGAFKLRPHDIGALVIGIGVVAILGEWVRRLLAAAQLPD